MPRAVQSGWLAILLAALVLWLPGRAEADESTWERDGLEGREVRALALLSGSTGLVGLVGGARDASPPLWLRDSRGWAQSPTTAPDFVLAFAPHPEGGLLLGVGRNIDDQPGVFMLAGSPPSSRRLYETQAVGALVVTPGKNGLEIYAATAPWADRDAGSELLRRDATTGNWSSILHGTLACGEMPSYFKQVTVASDSPNTILALEWCLAPVLRQTQLWRSDDHGQTWEVLSRRGGGYPLIGTVAVDPTDTDTLYLAGPTPSGHAMTGVERSQDGGKTWESLGQDVDGLSNIRVLVVDPRDPERVLAGTERRGVFLSHDGGENWRLLPGLEGMRVWSLVIDETNDRVYAATSDGVWLMPLP